MKKLATMKSVAPHLSHREAWKMCESAGELMEDILALFDTPSCMRRDLHSVMQRMAIGLCPIHGWAYRTPSRLRETRRPKLSAVADKSRGERQRGGHRG